MVHIARIDIRALIEQVLGDLDGRGEVQRSLSISTSGVNQRRIGCDQFLELVDHAEPSRRMDRDRRTALNRAGSDAGSAVSSSPNPPAHH